MLTTNLCQEPSYTSSPSACQHRFDKDNFTFGTILKSVCEIRRRVSIPGLAMVLAHKRRSD